MHFLQLVFQNSRAGQIRPSVLRSTALLLQGLCSNELFKLYIFFLDSQSSEIHRDIIIFHICTCSVKQQCFETHTLLHVTSSKRFDSNGFKRNKTKVFKLSLKEVLYVLYNSVEAIHLHTPCRICKMLIIFVYKKRDHKNCILFFCTTLNKIVLISSSSSTVLLLLKF